VIRFLRLFAVGWILNMKSLTRSGLFVFTSIIEPLIFATLSYYLFKAGHRPGTLLYASLSAGLMGIWTSTLYGSGGVISWQRWQGTLEPTVVSPPPLILIIFPMAVSTASIGLYSVAATLLWGRLAFGIPLDLVHPLTFALAIPVTILTLGALGLVIGGSFVLYRNANALANMLEFPVWLVTGALVPLSLLPGWIHPLSWILSPTWGFRAVRASALGGDAWPAIGMCVALGVPYAVVAAYLIRFFEVRARVRATLSLT
jgi:ABC-2 type transport system permease protein